MDIRWLKGFSADDFDKRRKEIASYKKAFEALRELLKREGEEFRPDYSSPSWAYRQADVNGANRKLNDIIRLLEIKD